ncbi:MAG: serine/threonine-protein kinase [Pirellulaceae bacterium]
MTQYLDTDFDSNLDESTRLTSGTNAPFPVDQQSTANLTAETSATQPETHSIETKNQRQENTSPNTATTKGMTAAPPDAMLGKSIGNYTIKSLIGSGGMGCVYLAEQVEPVRRNVAMKLMRAENSKAENAQRFLAERQALALMSHSDIAQVYDAGQTPEGHLYFAMELADGEPIDKFCHSHRLSLAERLQLIYRVCCAIEHAHQRGVVHRDIKPGNIIVSDLQGQTQVKVIDFGIAKALGDQSLSENAAETQVGQLMGTPAYMSPEQADLRNKHVDQRTDVYAIGALMYKLLTGTTPLDPRQLREKSLTEVLVAISRNHAERPSDRIRSFERKDRDQLLRQLSTDAESLTAALSSDLDWLVLKAVANERDDRYPSAAALGEDIRRYLNNEPISAVRPSLLYRTRTFYRRNRIGVMAAAVILAAVLTNAAVFTRFQRSQHASQTSVQHQLESLVDQIHSLRNTPTVTKTQFHENWQQLEQTVAQANTLIANNRFNDDLVQRWRQAESAVAADGKLLPEIETAVRLAANTSFFGGTPVLQSGAEVNRLNGLLEALGVTGSTFSNDQVQIAPIFEYSTRSALEMWLSKLPRGAGITLLRDANGYYAHAVHPDGAAALTGRIAPGDRLWAIGESQEISADSFTPDQLARLLNGPTGSLQYLQLQEQAGQKTVVVQSGGIKSDQIIALLNQMDSDDWRTQLRQAIQQGDTATMLQLAASPKMQAQPVSSLLLLASALRNFAQHDIKLTVLQTAQRLYPKESLANQALGEALAFECIPARMNEAARFLTASIATDEEERMISHLLLAQVLHAQGRDDEAISRFQHAIELQPESNTARIYYISSLRRMGRNQEAVEAYRSLAGQYKDQNQLKALLTGVYRSQTQWHATADNSTSDATTTYVNAVLSGEAARPSARSADD